VPIGDYYEAHAVLLNLKRKQMDSAGGMLAIARETNDAELRKAATAFQKAQKSSAETLTTSWPRTPPRSLPPHDRRHDPDGFNTHELEFAAWPHPGGVRPEHSAAR
jgi:hypothetical protein